MAIKKETQVVASEENAQADVSEENAQADVSEEETEAAPSDLSEQDEALLNALEHERAGYARSGDSDRADAVDAEIKKLRGDAAPAKKSRKSTREAD